jgi:hypothetical protein
VAPWPEPMREEASYGRVGQFVSLAEPHTALIQLFGLRRTCMRSHIL